MLHLSSGPHLHVILQRPSHNPSLITNLNLHPSLPRGLSYYFRNLIAQMFFLSKPDRNAIQLQPVISTDLYQQIVKSDVF